MRENMVFFSLSLSIVTSKQLSSSVISHIYHQTFAIAFPGMSFSK